LNRYDTQSDLKDELIAEATRLGFDSVRVASPELESATSRAFDAFIAAGRHGDMDWMADTAERRRAPTSLWPDVRSVITLAVNYGPDSDPLDLLKERDRGAISVYARGKDYHDIIKKRLKALARWLVDNAGGDVKVFVDTAPVLEKPIAQRAGIGWQGKHTNLVSRDFGSWLFLGEIFTTLDLSPDPAETDHCGGCQACLDICPTAAFPAPYQLDARRCISYLTIEHKGHIPRELRPLMGNRVYGCDDCLAICPWNKFAQKGTLSDLMPRMELTAPRLLDLAQLDDTDFRSVFAGSPIKRIGRDRFVRNVLIAIGNGAAQTATAVVEKLCQDESPLVRVAAVWALARINSERASDLRATIGDQESDEDVRAEWQAS